MIYYIYHIPGVKIGCTNNIDIRMIQQNFNSWEILEEHTDIYLASDREQELQRQYGYPVDKVPYWKICNYNKSSGGKVSITQLINHPNRKARCIKGGKSGVGGKIGGKTAGTNRAKELGTCKYCGKSGAHLGLIRWHYEKCKYKKLIE